MLRGLRPLPALCALALLPTLALAQRDTILVDFGGANTSPPPSNNVTDARGGAIADLTNARGFSSGYGLAVTDAFNNVNTDGTVAPAPALALPPSATGDSFFGNVAEFGGQTEPTGAVTLSGLTTGKPYAVELFASRTATDNRETQYVIAGATVDTVYLQVASNTAALAVATVAPDSTGAITVTASPGPANDNSAGFFYLGALRLVYDAEAPAGGTALTLTAPNGGEFYQVGRSAAITWESRNLGRVALDYSVDAGATWRPIDTVSAAAGAYAWSVPDAPSTESLVRIVADSLRDESDATFVISVDSSSCVIVVIGSSTAEGTGASSPDSGWVARYARSLAGDTRYQVVNLARGGYTTYHLLPTGTEVPGAVGIDIDEQRNVTRALDFDPFAIIVNLPSNDAARGFPVPDQLANFGAIAAAAATENTAVYITTTQPRNFDDAGQVAAQREVRDSIFAIYGERAIDFWNGLADERGFIVDSLDSGDGIHVNDAGHRLLFERVRAERLDTLACVRTSGVDGLAASGLAPLRVYPNPSAGQLYVALDAVLADREVLVEVVDLRGTVLFSRRFAGGAGEVRRLELGALADGAAPRQLFCVVTLVDAREVRRSAVPFVLR